MGPFGFNPAATGSGGLAGAFSSAPAPTGASTASVTPTSDTGQVPYKDAGNAPPATPPPSALINTSTQSRTATNNSSASLAAALAAVGQSAPGNNANASAESPISELSPSDPFVQGLNSLQATEDAATKSLIASTQAAYSNNLNSVNQQYTSYKAGLQQMGIESNAAQSSPDLLAGQIQSAANAQLSKIQGLQATLTKTIMDAQTAQANDDFKTLQEKMTYANQLQTEKTDAIKNMYDTITAQKTASDDEAAAIYSTMQSLDPSDQESYINAVAQQYNIPVTNLVSSLAAYSNTQSKANLETAVERADLTKDQQSIATTNAYIGIDTLLSSSGTTIPNSGGIPYVDSHGYITPQGFNTLITAARNDNITRAEFLAQYGSQLDRSNLAAYRLSSGEQNKINGITSDTGTGTSGSTLFPTSQ